MLEMLSWILEAFMFLAGYVGGSNSFPRQLTYEEESAYIKKMNDGDEDAKHTLIEHNLRLVAHIAKKYNDDRNSEDLISIGTIGLIKGINTFNCEKSIKLSSYISRCIENEILMYLRNTKKNNCEVSIEESVGIDKEGNNMSLSEILTADTTDMIELVSKKIENEQLYAAMENSLSESEKNILTWHYGLKNTQKKTQKEIAAILGISRSYVSRIEKRCLKKLLNYISKNDCHKIK